jgi:hypothetical protein
MARGDSGRGVARPARGGGSPELAVYGAPDLGFRRGFLLQHGSDVENLFCSPWEDDGQQWWLVCGRWLDSSSASMAAGSGAPPAKLRAPAWAFAFGETPGAVDLAPESG